MLVPSCEPSVLEQVHESTTAWAGWFPSVALASTADEMLIDIIACFIKAPRPEQDPTLYRKSSKPEVSSAKDLSPQRVLIPLR